MTAADLNGDGQPDLIVANSKRRHGVGAAEHDGAGATTPSFAAQQTFATGSYPDSVTVADLNGDGKPDLIVANGRLEHGVGAAEHDGAGATTASFAAQQTFATGSEPRSVTVADLNGDGQPDLIVANKYSNTVSVLLNTTAPGASQPRLRHPANLRHRQPAGIRDGGGLERRWQARPDRRERSLGHGVGAAEHDGAGATTPSFAAQQTFATGSEPFSVTAADLNGDGKPDLIVANYESNTVSVLLNTTATGATTPSFAAQQTFATGSEPRSVTAADLNGDGKPDLIVANLNSNTVSVLLNTTAPGATTPSFASQTAFATGTDPDSVTAADLNGDGKPDLIVANRARTRCRCC